MGKNTFSAPNCSNSSKLKYVIVTYACVNYNNLEERNHDFNDKFETFL